ncbi:MAG: ATP-dependent helicase [Candidatus Cloacimonetes bacterium]|nr:ATP-dependent helicase [Actinomycetota bacterium]MBL7087147.1 ATP-dependent helicase [Candidatus Cloacimonadota bacterium]
MKIDLKKIYNIDGFKPTNEQDNAIKSIKGANLIIAGPGSGKSQVLLMRTINLISNHKVLPENIILCTFTEKAANKIKERLSFMLDKLNININIHDIKCGTIHSICNKIIEDNIDISGFMKNYDILDEITQYLFINDNFKALFVQLEFGELYLNKWPTKYKTRAIQESIQYLNKITEENISIVDLKKSKEVFLKSLGMLYDKYYNLLVSYNKIDFPHLQKEALKIVRSSYFNWNLENIYLMVDEYQDTNNIQESIFFEIIKNSNNICVVGDDDQSVYRFRGATVKNIIDFDKKFRNVNKFLLNYNFRSQEKIINLYNYFINNVNWKNNDGKYLRHKKTIKAGFNKQKGDYESLLCVTSNSNNGADEVAEFVDFLYLNKIINDYSEVAILLKSVQYKYSSFFINAFKERNIRVYCPRARGFFDREETFLFLGAIFILFKDEKTNIINENLNYYLEQSEQYFYKEIDNNNEDKQIIKSLKERIKNSNKVIARDFLEIFYEIIALDIFQKLIMDKNVAYNIGLMSNLLQKFQSYYNYIPFTKEKSKYFADQFFSSFIGFLIDLGINEYEDKENLLPKGYVQLLTIHQSKGLEFPIVFVGTLENKFAGTHFVDKNLSRFYKRITIEPISKYNLFDNTRLFYVAFSRAMNFLVLLASKGINKNFGNISEYTTNIKDINKKKLVNLRFSIKERKKLKKKLSITGDVILYETCPKQYEIFRDFGFSQSSTAQFSLGLLVHNTIEDVHKKIIKDRSYKPVKTDLLNILDENVRLMKLSNSRILGKILIDNARKQIINYYNNFKDNFAKILDCEKLIILEKENFYLVGRIDAIYDDGKGISLVDFKAHKRPENINGKIIKRYKNQLSIYIHQLIEKFDQKPNNSIIFFTGEADKRKSILKVNITDYDIKNSTMLFDDTAKKILTKDYVVEELPNYDEICSQCDYRKVCYKK